MAGGKRFVKGDRSFRKLLRRLPDDAKDEMADVLELAGHELLTAMRADAPRRTGALAAGLSAKLLRGALKLKVGLIGKPISRRLFYGRIVEFGRKAQTVTVVRTTTKSRSYHARLKRSRGEALRKPYQMRVRAMAPRPFVYSKRTDLRRVINERVKGAWERILNRAATGDLGDD